jgi:HD-GYP domain-containing protein (c-di-GMP phosphodiesterase class II)/DNA-binding CsgD family transcriptional regulator
MVPIESRTHPVRRAHPYTRRMATASLRPDRPSGVRLAELLAVLSLGADLGMGQPMEHAMRQCLIALRLGDRVGLGEAERTDLYFGSLIAWVGCHVDAYEQAKWFGDDLALKDGFRHYDLYGARPRMAMMRSHLGRGRSLGERAQTVVAFAGHGRRDVGEMLANHWFAADRLAEAVGLDDGVRTTVMQTFERWDGKGSPYGARGDEICVASRIVNLADVLEVYHRSEGAQRAVEVARQRSGTQFDPELVELVARDGATLFRDLDEATTWEAVIAGEPGLERALTDGELDLALTAFADFIDIKSPYTLGHSRGVADLATAAGAALGLEGEEVRRLRRAALLHDLGRLGVSNGVWDKPGALTASESERVRLHPYLTERMLASCPVLAGLGEIAVQHHERLDGSGYPRGLRGDALTVSGRVLAAADAYHGKLEVRPHRSAVASDAAAAWLRGEVRAGRFDGEAADAVLIAAGHAVRRRKDWPAGLTTREVEVLRLLARGLSNRAIAERLTISRRTVDNHVDHIYTKLGVSNRARASLLAVRHGLMSVVEDGAFDS